MQEESKPDYLAYSNESITKIIQLLGQMNINGIQNIKSVSSVLLLLENPSYILPKEALMKNDESITKEEIK